MSIRHSYVSRTRRSMYRASSSDLNALKDAALYLDSAVFALLDLVDMAESDKNEFDAMVIGLDIDQRGTRAMTRAIERGYQDLNKAFKDSRTPVSKLDILLSDFANDLDFIAQMLERSSKNVDREFRGAYVVALASDAADNLRRASNAFSGLLRNLSR